MTNAITDSSHADANECARIVAAGWGIATEPTHLGSMQDSVFRLDIDGVATAALKLSSSDRVDEQLLDAEAGLLRHVSRHLPRLALPLLKPGLDGRVLQHQGSITARMMAWVGGVPLAQAPRFTEATLQAMGRISGQISRSLVSFDHPGLHRDLEWDPRRAVATLGNLVPQLVGDQRDLIVEALRRIEQLPPEHDERLPWQATHLDLTDFNVIGRFDPTGDFYPEGIVDFGDMAWTWRLCELAVTAHAAIGRNPNDPLAALFPVVAGFVLEQDLTPFECDHLWTLIVARAAICAATEHLEAATSPDNEYAQRLAQLDTAALRGMLAVNQSLARGVIRQAAGLTPYPVDIVAMMKRRLPEPMLPANSASAASAWHSCVTVDGTAADLYAPNVLRLAGQFHVSSGTPVRSPLDGLVVSASGTTLTLAHHIDDLTVYLRIGGAAPVIGAGDSVARGQVVATVDAVSENGHAPNEIDVQLATEPSMPELGAVRNREVWAWLCPNPSELVGARLPDTPCPMTLDHRRQHVATAQPVYYDVPPEMVRAHGQWMYDDTGRRYLDMVNNVAGVGHCHPRVVAAAADQMGLLNTNSRFLYRAMADFAGRIAQTLPPQLQTVFFVNTGTEANELALQVARRYTGRGDVVTLQGAYHGWTTDVFELCTLPGDRPNWQSELAPWVHIAECPDPFRGTLGAAGEPYLKSLSVACADADDNGGLAAFVHEPIFGSRGGVIPPPGYLTAAYAIARKFGGLCIADEVQVGYGRTGETFWAFESQGVVPDIVTSAKAAGNGHPVGFVACRSEIADYVAESFSYFSTPAGNPVSCRIGSAVLDVMRDERLQHNAAEIGAYMSQELSRLASQHWQIGALYGRGLYQGIDLVASPDSTTPMAPAQVGALCARLLELGCIAQPTGLFSNVLKVKPPLCIQRSDADRFISALDQALTEQSEFAALAR